MNPGTKGLGGTSLLSPIISVSTDKDLNVYGAGDMLVLADASIGGADITITLPDVKRFIGKIITIKKINDYNYDVLVYGHSGQTIEGATYTEMVDAAATLSMISNGVEWKVISASDYFFLDSLSASAVPTSTQYGDVTAFTIPAGLWDISLLVDYLNNGATVTDARIGIGDTIGNSASGLQYGQTLLGVKLPTALTNGGGMLGPIRFSQVAPITRYAKLYLAYTVATPKYNATLTARRVG